MLINERGFTLEDLAKKYDTDKQEKVHGYAKIYHLLFGGLEPNIRIRLLEMGIWRGGSLLMWEEYFPEGRIVGVDVDSQCIRYFGPRIVTEWADQSNYIFMRPLCERHGPFDIVIDDAVHTGPAQLKAFYSVFPMYLHPGSFYIIEDASTNDTIAVDHFLSSTFPGDHLGVKNIRIMQGNTTKSQLIVIEKEACYRPADVQIQLESVHAAA